jgi:hypothetical protein
MPGPSRRKVEETISKVQTEEACDGCTPTLSMIGHGDARQTHSHLTDNPDPFTVTEASLSTAQSSYIET